MNTESNLFCKVIKLTNGDNIVCLTDDKCDNLIESQTIMVMDPMIVTPIRMPRFGKIVESYILHPWVPISDEKIFEIRTSTIISAVEVRSHFREQYENFIEQSQQIESETITAETDISDNLEAIQTLMKNMTTNQPEELEDDDDPGIWESASRTIH